MTRRLKPAPKSAPPPRKPPLAPAKPAARKPAPVKSAPVRVKSAPPPAKLPPPRAKPAHRPAYEPTAQDRLRVKLLAAGGFEQDSIAAAIGVAPKTLRKHFRHEIDQGATEVAATVIGGLLAMASKGNAHAAMFWLEKRVPGFAPRSELTITDATPLTALSDADIAARIAHLQRSAITARARKRSEPLH